MGRQMPAGDLVQIGLRIRRERQARGLTLADVAGQCGLTKGLLSKIENFRAIPSLPVLAGIAQALGVDLAELVRGVGAAAETPYLLLRAADRQAVERDEAVGFMHEPLLARPVGEWVFEVMVLTVQPGGRRRPVTTDGLQFIYLLDGELLFQLGEDRLELKAGDALYFDGSVPHVPLNETSVPARLLAVYLLRAERSEA